MSNRGNLFSLTTFNYTMTEQSSEGSLVRYYCTAGNGMERFLMDELKQKLAAEDVSVSCKHVKDGDGSYQTP